MYYDDIWVSQGALLAQTAGKAEAREGRSPPCAAQPLLLVVHQNNHRRDHSDQILSSQNPGACKSVDWIIEINFSEEYAACSSIYHEDSFAEQTDQSRMFNVPRCVRNKNEEGYVKPILGILTSYIFQQTFCEGCKGCSVTNFQTFCQISLQLALSIGSMLASRHFGKFSPRTR